MKRDIYFYLNTNNTDFNDKASLEQTIAKNHLKPWPVINHCFFFYKIPNE